MTNTRFMALVGALLLCVFTLFDSLFIVGQTEQAILFQFRDAISVIRSPGLHFKMPLIQSVTFFDNRVLAVDAPTQEIIMAEQKPLEVDAYTRYRIVDPLLYYQRLNNERIANDRLGSLLNANLRSVLCTIKMAVLLSPERVPVMAKIRDILNREARDFGIEIVDVRIRRADLPQKTSDAVFARMRSQREQEAAQLRATGQQEALETTADADRQATIILAEAQGKAQKLMGDGDSRALQMMAEATSKDPQFYGFWRSLAAYRESMKANNTTFMLSPQGSFFKVFNGSAPSP